MKIEEAVSVLRKELKSQSDYRYTWQANIAIQFKDEWQRVVEKYGLPCTPEHIHEISNKAADNFLTLLEKEK